MPLQTLYDWQAESQCRVGYLELTGALSDAILPEERHLDLPAEATAQLPADFETTDIILNYR